MNTDAPKKIQEQLSAAASNNPLVTAALILAASIMGNTGVQSAFPQARNDPFTGKEGKALETRIVRIATDCGERHREQEIRIDALASLQALDNEHRATAAGRQDRMRTLETEMAKMIQAQLDTKEQVRMLRTEIRQLLRGQ